MVQERSIWLIRNIEAPCHGVGEWMTQDPRSSSNKLSLVRPVELVGSAGLVEPVPMRPPSGYCGITLTDVRLSGAGVVSVLRGVWRPRFGSAAASVGDVVLELLEPATHVGRTLDREPTRDAAGTRVGVRLLVAADAAAGASSARMSGRRGPGWLWLGSWPCVGSDWPFLVGPLAFITWCQEHRDAPRGAPHRPLR
jgi:hypothetical protein